MQTIESEKTISVQLFYDIHRLSMALFYLCLEHILCIKKAIPRFAGWLLNYFNLKLYPEMRKSLVGFCHLVGIFFFLECTAFTPAGRNNFIGQFICHAPSVSFP